MSLPRIVVTTGEPAGIGPDIMAMLAQRAFAAELVTVADSPMLARRAEMLGLPLTLRDWNPRLAAQAHRPGQLQVLHTPVATEVLPGVLDPANAPYVLQTLQTAVTGCLAADFAAMVTAPVQKSVINDAGIQFSGHTEFLAQATGCQQVVMMLATSGLRVALATTHLPLAAVPAAITRPLLESTLTILHRELVAKFGLPQPRIAVLGLNPHAGEGGHMGREEIDTIIPALNLLRAKGLQLLGPLPADTAFNPKVLNDVDAVFAMYHDQGLPVLKFAGFGKAVNITLGLPIVRTSVDHGTALDLAGGGQANADSLLEAILLAIEMANGAENC